MKAPHYQPNQAIVRIACDMFVHTKASNLLSTVATNKSLRSLMYSTIVEW